MLPALAKSGPVAAGLAFFLTLTGLACSSSEDQPELVSERDFAARFASVWCNSVAPCCATERLAYASAECQSHARDHVAAMLSARIVGDTRYSPSAGTDCLERLEPALAACNVEAAGSACALIFVGTLANGTPCRNGSACKSGYCALSEVSSGVCAEAIFRPPMHGKAGESCVGSCGVPGSFECPAELLPSGEGTTRYCYAEDGLYCTFDPSSADTLACRPYATVGEACTGVACAPGSFCADGTCVAQRATGSCAETPELCLEQSYCDPAGQCQPKQANGSACTSGEACTSHSCRTGGVCDSGNTLLARGCSGMP